MNQVQKLRTFALAMAAAMVFAAVVVPGVNAQSKPSLTFTSIDVTYSQGDSNAIVPDTGKATVEIDWEWQVQTSGYDQIGAVQSSTLLQFNTHQCENSNLKVSGPTTYPIRLKDASGAPQGQDDGTATFTITATQQAPGEQPISCTFKGTSQEIQGQIDESNEGSINTDVVVRYLGLISASIPTTIKQAGPQKQIQYDMEVTNLGNSLSNIRFTLRDAEGAAAGGWNPVAPTPVVLQSESQGGTNTVSTVSFLVSTPFKNGWNNAEKTFTMDITPESTKNPDMKGSVVTMNVLARVRGVYVPSIEPFVMVGAVLGSALLVRLMRDEE